ncbi:male sterility protein-domain-containing protein [Aspergillus granulosus]|uniref:Male sterility protein-domain-containing protein n=1 Tax=Aspergillus granulosus TaxID=176169 RepID=A0ABR4HDI0_9EURO
MVETEPYQAVFASYPLQTEFRTKDLFTPHPIIPSIWTHASRSDDVIVFLNGEKVNPVDFESRVCQHPHVAAALMVGEKRFEAVLLVELVGQMQGGLSVAERARVIKMLWPVIKEANKIVPAYARVEETHVFFTEPGRPVLRTLKGTVRRKATIELYKDTIEQVYKDVEEIGTAISGRRELGSEEIQTLVREALHDTTNIGKIETSEDFFSRGMDSLQVLRLVRHLRASTALGDINPSLVYLNPSITALSTALYQLAQDGQISERKIREERMNIREQVLQKHLNAIDSLIPSDIKSTPIPQHNSSDKVVILTGSTGTIGGYILSVLLTRPDIAHIYCLNRSPDSGTLQAQRNAQQDSSLPLTFPGSKVTFLTVDLTHPTLSLEDAVYESLKKRTTHVIHNAWKVDFNLPLQSFEAQLGGTVNLIRLCADASHTPTLVFISSVSAAMNFSSTISSPENPTPIPETILFDLATPAPAGYAESKYIAERLLAHAAKTLSITSKVLRLGQIAGAAKSLGRWNSADWVPALILGSRELSAIPDKLSGFDDESMIDWAPVDAIAEVIVEIGVDSTAEPGPDIDGKNGNGSISVFHALNPHREPWSSLLPSIISALESDSDSRGPEQKRVIEIVSPSEWVSRLRAAARRPSPADQKEQASVDVNPALRLFEFFSERFGGSGTAPESLGWETGNAEMLSKTLREVEGIDGGLMGRWVAQWMEGEK